MITYTKQEIMHEFQNENPLFVLYEHVKHFDEGNQLMKQSRDTIEEIDNYFNNSLSNLDYYRALSDYYND